MDSFSYDFSSKVTLGWYLCPGARARERGPSLRASQDCCLPSQDPWQAALGAGATPKVAAAPQPGCTRGQRGLSWCWGLQDEGSSETALPFAKAHGPPCILGLAGPVLGGLGWISVFPEAAAQHS